MLRMRVAPALRNPGMLFGLSTANSDPEAWKKMIGNTRVCARLDPLPAAKPRWSALLASTLFQTLVTVFLTLVPALFPGNLVSKNSDEAIFVAPETEITLPETQPVLHARVVSPSSSAVEPIERPTAKLTAPRSLIPAESKGSPVKSVDAPKLDETSTELNFQTSLPQPGRPREPVKIGTLSSSSEPPLESSKPIVQVQTGGFGDPNGLPAESGDKRGNVGRAGLPALLPGPGYGNGAGGLSGARGAVARAGFGDDAEISAGPKRSEAVVKPGAFEAAALGSAAPKSKQANIPPAVQPVVILAKPDPAYSEEARQLGLEGEVLVDVIFLASGEVRVLRVTRGLGHGLDEASIRAAQQIRFKPALEDGKPMDFPATVHIQFELAF